MKKLISVAAAVATLAISVPSLAQSMDGEAVLKMNWQEVVEAAKGGEVNFFHWGGSDNINAYVGQYIGDILKEEYDITLNRVGTGAAEAVNIVLTEVESGVTDKGSVDLIWINGENFRTMKQGNLVFCGYTDTLPNDALVNWDNPSIANDFGMPVDGCEVPWSKTQFAFAYDKARTDVPPQSIAELIEWIIANPGRFTYAAPPDFNGSVFVRHVFYHAAGGVDGLLGDFNQEKYDEVSTKTWRILNELEPYLWREGKTYPTTINAMEQLFANSEVDLYFNYSAAGVGVNIENGTFPPTVQGYGLKDGTIGNTNYTAIPINSKNKAAAMVLQNLMLSSRAQYQKALPDVWGAAAAVEVSRMQTEYQEKFATIKTHPSVVPESELAKNALPELQASWLTAIEKGWLENVGK